MTPREYIVLAVQSLNKQKNAAIEILDINHKYYASEKIEVQLKFNKAVYATDSPTIISFPLEWFNTDYIAIKETENKIPAEYSGEVRVAARTIYVIWDAWKNICCLGD